MKMSRVIARELGRRGAGDNTKTKVQSFATES
jgi:hypothetical protein